MHREGVVFDAEEGGRFECRPGVVLDADQGVAINAEGGALSMPVSTRDEIRFFKREGYLIKRGALDQELIARDRERKWAGRRRA